MLPTREEALKILNEHVKDNYQILHSKMVAAAMEACAKKYDQDQELWYITGLLHDMDYFEYPEKHPDVSVDWFKEWGYPSQMIQAVIDHKIDHQNKPATLPKISAALIACDELSGLIYAYSLMRPTGLTDMEAKSVKKKFKDKAFAAKINRDDISYGIQMLQADLVEHIELLINTFKSLAEFAK